MSDFEHDFPQDSPDVADLVRIAEQLRAERPVIRANVRGDIRRRLEDQGRVARPRRFWRVVVSTSVAGFACLAIAATGLAHIGPWNPQKATSANATAPAGAVAITAQAAPRADSQ